jgi:hypothetical protein
LSPKPFQHGFEREQNFAANPAKSTLLIEALPSPVLRFRTVQTISIAYIDAPGEQILWSAESYPLAVFFCEAEHIDIMIEQ